MNCQLVLISNSFQEERVIYPLNKFNFKILVFLSCCWVNSPQLATAYQANQLEQVNSLVTPTLNSPQMIERISIPATFKVHGSGVELVSIDEGKPIKILSGNNQFILEPGDVIAEIGNTKTFNEYGIGLAKETIGSQTRIPMAIVNVQNNKAEQVVLTPELVAVPAVRYRSKPTVDAKVYVVHIVDTDDPSIGGFAASNIQPMISLFQTAIGEKRRASYSLLCGKKVNEHWQVHKKFFKNMNLRLRDCSAISIVNELSQLPIRQQDSLFVYYQGHGAYDPRFGEKDLASGHYLNLGGKDLLRSQLVKAMASKNAAMTVLITDCCNTTVPHKPSFFVKEMKTPITGWSGLESLLFCHTGFVDITAASRGKSAWYVSGIGGIFTHSFIRAAGTHKIREWPEFLTTLSNQAAENYSKLRDYVTGNPAGVLENVQASLKTQESMRPRFYRTDLRKNLPNESAPGSRNLTVVSPGGSFLD